MAKFQVPPRDRDEILRIAGPQKELFYTSVREVLNELEEAAEWDSLYYPPVDIGEFVQLQLRLVKVIKRIPERFEDLPDRFVVGSVSSALEKLPKEYIGEGTRNYVLQLISGTRAKETNSPARQLVAESLDRIPPEALPEGMLEVVVELLKRPLGDRDQEAIEELIKNMPESVVDAGAKEALDNSWFYFGNIHDQAKSDLEKLKSRAENIAAVGRITDEERAKVCEIAADLKGKYTSSVMGAAAALIADPIWDGAEIEPILFEEKSDESDRNERLVETLQEILVSIGRFPEDVPLVKFAEQWRQGIRVDRYALSRMYAFLGDVGKLMEVGNRRALYSGDYHQIQHRESLLSTRINEIITLHNMTWGVGTSGSDQNVEYCYPQLVLKTLEFAAVFNVEILKQLLGGDLVTRMHGVVIVWGERRKALGESADKEIPAEMLRNIPEDLRSIVPLLCDEDLKTFFDLLLGSVLKRGSFQIKRKREGREAKERAEAEAEAQKAAALAAAAPVPVAPAPVAPAPPVAAMDPSTGTLPTVEMPQMPALDMDTGNLPIDMDLLELDVMEESGTMAAQSPTPLPSPAATGEAPSNTASDLEQKFQTLKKLQKILRDLTATSNTHRKSFDLVYRFLKQKKMVPPTMLQSTIPFLETLTHTLVPHLNDLSSFVEVPPSYHKITEYCEAIQRSKSPADIKKNVPVNMERILHLIDGLNSATTKWIDDCSAALEEVAYGAGGVAGGAGAATDPVSAPEAPSDDDEGDLLGSIDFDGL